MRDLLEIATDENFDEAAYLAANPDVEASGIPARFHFEKVGRSEGRKQFTPDRGERASKYHRLRHALASPYGDDPVGTFPIVTGTAHHDLSSYPRESANPSYASFDRAIASDPDGLYLDLGCGFRERTFDNCIYVEVYNSRSADLIVEPNCLYPIRDSVLNGIGCFAVLEHTRKPWQVVQEMRRMLKPGGRVFIDWPFLQPVHGYPSHFFNATREGLSSIFEDEGFSVDLCFTDVNQTAAYTINWILGAMAARLPAGRIRKDFLRMRVCDLIALDRNGPEWRGFVEALDEAAKEELACGNFLIATKAGG
jgi:SAM-dependent methyltransferase